MEHGMNNKINYMNYNIQCPHHYHLLHHIDLFVCFFLFTYIILFASFFTHRKSFIAWNLWAILCSSSFEEKKLDLIIRGHAYTRIYVRTNIEYFIERLETETISHVLLLFSAFDSCVCPYVSLCACTLRILFCNGESHVISFSFTCLSHFQLNWHLFLTTTEKNSS